MKPFLAFLMKDWRRKLGAIAIALALWSWIEGRIANDADLTLKIAFTTEDIGTPDDFQLLIQAPPGWVLTDPPIGSSLTIWVNGSKSEIQSFTTKQCAANFVANFIPDEEDNLYTVDVSPEELDWMRPGDAQMLLGDIPESQKMLKQLVFERVKTATVSLTPSEVQVDGTPSEAHEVRSEQLRFTPNTVTLTGPQATLDSLLAEIAEAHSAVGEILNSALLEDLQVPEGTRIDISQSAGLNQRWVRKGIKMNPPLVLVDAMVRLKDPIRIQFNPTLENIHVTRTNGSAAADIWELAWEPEPWWVSLPHVESDRLISETWVQEHVRLFVPLHTLNPDDVLTSQKVRIEAHIVGIEDSDDQSFFEQHLVIGPEEGSDNDMITVKRKQ